METKARVGVEIFSPLEEDCNELRKLAAQYLGNTDLEYGGVRPQYGEQKNDNPSSFFYYDKTHYRHLYFVKA